MKFVFSLVLIFSVNQSLALATVRCADTKILSGSAASDGFKTRFGTSEWKGYGEEACGRKLEGKLKSDPAFASKLIDQMREKAREKAGKKLESFEAACPEASVVLDEGCSPVGVGYQYTRHDIYCYLKQKCSVRVTCYCNGEL